MDPRIQQFQQALLTRGIRLQEDDPLFVLLVLNEVHFQQLAVQHYQSVNKQLMVDVVTAVLARQQKEVIRCQGGLDADRAARRLESSASFFSQLEEKTSDIARQAGKEEARITAGKMLTTLTGGVEAQLAKLELMGDQTARMNDIASRMLQGAKLIYDESRKTRIKMVSLVVAGILIFILGVYLGLNFGH